jgi:surfeit locus 1 family protein
MLRTLARPRWIAGAVVVIVVVVAFVELGFWQLRRLHERRVFNAAVISAEHAPAELLDRLLASRARDADALAYHKVEFTGTYDAAHEVVLFGRTLAGRTGSELLTPLVGRARAVVVDRGWVPLAMATPPVRPAAPSAGPVRVSGILWPPEADTAPPAGSPPVAQLGRIDLGRLQAQLPYRIEPVYLWLQDQQPAQSSSLPRPVPLPPLGEGPHFSYAIQWFTFASIAAIGYVVLLRKESAQAQAPDADAEAGS